MPIETKNAYVMSIDIVLSSNGYRLIDRKNRR